MLAHIHICLLHRQKGPALQQPPPTPKAQVVLPRCPHSNRALLPSMEERGRETAVTSKRRKEAGRGSRGMWGREVGEAAVWEAASPRGRRPAHLGTSCSLGWWPRTCTQPRRLPQPNDSRPVPKPEIPGERIRRKGSPAPMPGSPRDAFASLRLVPTDPGTVFPRSQTVHWCWPSTREPGRGSWRPRCCERPRTFAPSQRPPLSLLTILGGEREEAAGENGLGNG